MATNERDEVLAVVTSFWRYLLDTPPPLTDALNYVLPDSFFVLAHWKGVIQCTLKEFISRVEKELIDVHETGPDSVKGGLCEPGPDIWVDGRLAAVWTGHTASVWGSLRVEGVSAITLFKREDGWKIGGIAATQWGPHASPNTLVGESTTELLKPVLESNRLLNEKRWDEIDRPLYPGGGCTYARFPHTLSSMLWPELNEKMKAMAEKAPGHVEHKLMNWEVRMMGDLGFVWTPVTVTLNGEVKISGYHDVYTLLKRDNKWLIIGSQDG